MDWTKRLFGQTYEPLTAGLGVAKYLASLADTPASRSATQASASEPTTPATSGPQSQPSSETSSPSGASSRTSALICDSEATKSPENFKAWATRLRASCLQRKKSARLTGGSGYSSWPTARASYNENRTTKDAPSHGVTHGATLAGRAANWQTPNAAAEAPNLGSNIKNGPKSLLAQAEWATPTSRDWKDGANPSSAVATNSLLGRQAPRMPMAGDESLPSAPTSRRRLNPRFVEWLMGWGDNWTSLVQTNSTSSATESSPLKPPTPSTSSKGHSLRITNKLNLPQPIVDAVANDDYTRGIANISATGLLAPPRQAALLEAHGADLEEDASDRIFSLFGKAIHGILETQKAGNDIREQRLYMNVDGPLGPWVVSGAMDRIAFIPAGEPDPAYPKGTIRIEDYKTASVNEMIYGVKAERAQQLNIYRVLAELNGYKVESLAAVFILRDWSKVQAHDKASQPTLSSSGVAQTDYPQTHVIVHEIDIWPIEEAYRFIGERVALHQNAQSAYAQAVAFDPYAPQAALPECDDEERWARDKSYAAMKPGGKRASKVGEQAEIEAWVAAKKPGEYVVEERAGRSLRCEFYCAAAPICAQWKAMRDA